MTIALDTNVLIGAINEQGDYKTDQTLLVKVAEGKADGIITANSITDIYYILRKRIGDTRTREAIWNLMAVFEVADVNAQIYAAALSSPMKDFEDAVLAFCARKSGAEYIVTRDIGFIDEENSPVKAVSPKEMLSFLEDNA